MVVLETSTCAVLSIPIDTGTKQSLEVVHRAKNKKILKNNNHL